MEQDQPTNTTSDTTTSDTTTPDTTTPVTPPVTAAPTIPVENQEKPNTNNVPDNPQNYAEFMQFKRFEIQQKNQKSERKLRKKNARLAFYFSSAWAIFIGIVVLLHGFGQQFKFFTLSQTEFLFIIGSLTGSIFAFYTLVLRYLFYRNPMPSDTASTTANPSIPPAPAGPANNIIA